MSTDLQLLKRYGHLPGVALSDCSKESARSVIQDTDYGFLTGRFCGCPDQADEEIADAEPSVVAAALAIDIREAAGVVDQHRRMAAYNNAKWPASCHPVIGSHHVVKVYVDWDSCPQHNMRLCRSEELDQIVEAGVWPWSRDEVQELFGQMPMAKVALALAFEAYRILGVQHVEVDDGPDGTEHQIHIRFLGIPGSTIGVGWFPSGQCGDHVNQHIDVISFSLMGLARLFCHELGHNHGEPHQFTGQSTHHSVMSYNPPRLFYGFSTGQSPYPLPRDRSLDSLEEKYGGDPVSKPLGGGTGPTPPPPTETDWRVVETWTAGNSEWQLRTRPLKGGGIVFH